MKPILALLLMCASCHAQNKLQIGELIAEGGVIQVFFKGPHPEGAGAKDPSRWSIVLFSKDGDQPQLAVPCNGTIPCQIDVSQLPVVGRVGLPLSYDTTRIDQIAVQYRGANNPKFTWTAPESTPAPATPFVAATDKKNADVYISGTYSPAFNGADALFSLDSSAHVGWYIHPDHPRHGRLGFLGEVKTDKRKRVDPDSYRTFFVYDNVLLDTPHWPWQGITLQWNAVGAEFERKADNLNVLTSPMLEFPMRLYPKKVKSAAQPIVSLRWLTGFEAGSNLSNAVTEDGLGGIFRGLLGFDASVTYKPKKPWFRGVSLASSYRVRLPFKDEVFTVVGKDASGKDVDQPTLSTQARHRVESEVNFFVTEPFALTFKHEYGSVPPAFRLVNHKFSIGFTYMLMQSNGIRAAFQTK